MKSSYRTICRLPSVNRALVLRSMLESQSIDSFIPDEHTARWISDSTLISIRLQVLGTQFDQAVEYIKSTEFKADLVPLGPEGFSSSVFRIEYWLEQARKRRSIQLSIVAFLLLIIVIPVTLLYFMFKPNAYTILLRHDWYTSRIVYNGQSYSPNTLNSNFTVLLIPLGAEGEQVSFNKDGTATLPGINCHAVNARWQLEGDSLTIYSADTLDYVYNGHYALNYSESVVHFRSQMTYFRLHSSAF